MDYSQLKIKDQFIGKKLQDNSKSYILTDDMDARFKRYIYNMVTKDVFKPYTDAEDTSLDINLSEPVTEKEIKIINVILNDIDKEPKVFPKKTRKPRTPKTKK